MTLVFEILRRYLPQLLLALAVLALVGGIYWLGKAHGEASTAAHYEGIIAERDRQAAQALHQALDDQRANAEAAIAAARKHAAAQANTEAQFRTITQTVVEYVDKNPSTAHCTAGTDFLRIWNSANSGAANAGANP